MKILTALTSLALVFPAAAKADAHRYVLTDTASGTHVESFTLTAADLGITDAEFTVRKYTLHGGKQEGVDIVEVDNGQLTFSVIPTRGMSIYKVKSGDVTLGWNSPVKEVVNPAFITLEDNGGLGWLDGFNEMMVRCGYNWAGHPGDDDGRLMTLHGRAGNIPASIVEIRIDKEAPYRIRVRGQVNEKTFKFLDYQAWTEISTEPGSSAFSLDDTITNLSDYEREMQIIYHGNFGDPLLEKGAEFVAPVKQVVPFDASAAVDLKGWTTYLGPTVGYGERVYNVTPFGDKKGMTTVMLQNAAADRGVSLSYDLAQLPAFSLWKNTDTKRDGYVTGLEPGTGFAYTRATERKHGRVPKLKGGESRRFQLTYEILLSKDDVAGTTKAIKAIQGKRKTTVIAEPIPIPETE